MGPGAGLEGCENLAPTGLRSTDRQVRSESLYRLSNPGPLLSTRGWCNRPQCQTSLNKLCKELTERANQEVSTGLFKEALSDDHMVASRTDSKLRLAFPVE